VRRGERLRVGSGPTALSLRQMKSKPVSKARVNTAANASRPFRVRSLAHLNLAVSARAHASPRTAWNQLLAVSHDLMADLCKTCSIIKQ
jgi:hypothetical protein